MTWCIWDARISYDILYWLFSLEMHKSENIFNGSNTYQCDTWVRHPQAHPPICPCHGILEGDSSVARHRCVIHTRLSKGILFLKLKRSLLSVIYSIYTPTRMLNLINFSFSCPYRGNLNTSFLPHNMPIFDWYLAVYFWHIWVFQNVETKALQVAANIPAAEQLNIRLNRTCHSNMSGRKMTH